jgi:hypothetical protein
MKRSRETVLIFAGLLFLASSLAQAQSCINGNEGAAGTGPQSPGNICITSFTYPYQSDPTKAQICATTPSAGDFLVESYWEINGASSPMADNYAYYSSTMSTSHCGVVTGLMPGGRGNYLLSVASCGSGPGHGGSFGQNCKRTDPNTSIAPWGNAQSNGLQFSTVAPSSGTFNWTMYAAAASQNMWQGHMTPIAISNQWISGASTPNYLMVQSITVDGQTCGDPVDNRMSCGSTGVVVQYTADNSEAPSASQSNISGSYLVEGGAYAGHYFCQAQAQCFEGPFNNFILVTPGTSTSTCSNACHVVSMTMQGTDSNQNNVGPPATVTYNFSVLPQPVFQPVAPTTFPPIPGMSNYWAYLASYGQTQSQCGSDCYGVQSVVQMLNAELNSPGWYFGGDNFSSGLTVGPLGIWNYDGTRVAYGVETVLSTAPRWQSLHNYTQWSAVMDGNNVEVNTSACTSSSSRCPTAKSAVCGPRWSGTIGNKTSDGSCTWVNVGNGSTWNLVAERIFDQVSDWQRSHDHWTTDSEWNRFTDGDAMHAFRNYATVNSSTPDTRAVEYFLFPFFSPSGDWANTNQRIIWNAFAPETDTMRDREYEIPALYNCWLMGCFGLEGPVDNGVDELKLRVDAIIADAERIYEYTPTVGGPFPIPGGMGTASFDAGLVSEALIHYCAVQTYMGQQCDTRIHVVLSKLLDWLYSNEFNLTGSDWSLPYALWTVPFGPQICRSGCTYKQSDLNMLLATAYAWLGANNGGTSYVLPTSGVSAWTVADTMFQHAFDNVYGGSKEFSQLYKWIPEYLGYRNGTLAGNDSLILPPHNVYLGHTTPTIEPYPQAEYPAGPTSTVNGDTVTFTWYNTKPVVTSTVKVSLGCTGVYAQAFTGSANRPMSGSDTLYVNTVVATGLAAGQYCAGFGGTDSLGQAGFAAVDVMTGQQDWTFYVN